MKVLFVASECAPVIKVGGLADVVGSLPKALRSLKVEPKVIIPLYEKISGYIEQLPGGIDSGDFTFAGRTESYRIYKGFLPATDIELIFPGSNS